MNAEDLHGFMGVIEEKLGHMLAHFDEVRSAQGIKDACVSFAAASVSAREWMRTASTEQITEDIDSTLMATLFPIGAMVLDLHCSGGHFESDETSWGFEPSADEPEIERPPKKEVEDALEEFLGSQPDTGIDNIIIIEGDDDIQAVLDRWLREHNEQKKAGLN
jgi:hypothetical protein